MIEHYDVLHKLKKDSFLIKFYEKHVSSIRYKKRFEDIMDAFSVAFRLSSDYVFKKEIKNSRISGVLNVENLIIRDEEIHANRLRSVGTGIMSYSAYDILSDEIKPKEKVEYWTLKHKDSKGFHIFSDNFFYFSLKDNLICIEYTTSSSNGKVFEDKELNKYMVEKNEGPFSVDCKIEINNLDNLEEVLNRILILVG